MKPQPDIIAAIFDAAQHDLEQLRDAFADMVEQANSRPRPHLRPVASDPTADTIRAHGHHTDPTGETAIKPNPARDWLKATRHDLLRLQTRVAQAEHIIGPAICRTCHEPLADRPTKKLHGVAYHEGNCYQRAYRALKAAA